MGDVTILPVVTKLPIPPERVLNGALEVEFEDVIVIGFTKTGDGYFASSSADGGDVVWQLERAKLKLLKIVDDENA